jgi:RNA polymerase sigma-70 factor (ECF subfamily)
MNGDVEPLVRIGAALRPIERMGDERPVLAKEPVKEPALDEPFLTLLNGHLGMIHRISKAYATSHLDRQDLFQEIVYQLWRSYPKYRGESSPITWLYRVALNTAITAVRKRSRRPTLVPLETGDHRVEPQSPTHESEMASLHVAIARLNDIERALLMCYLEDLSYARISEIFGISESNVGVRLSRIKTKLRKLVAGVE